MADLMELLMSTQPAQILLCTVGTSLFASNLDGLVRKLNDGSIDDRLKPLAEAYRDRNWNDLADHLGELSPSERMCGAEINSLHSLLQHHYAVSNAGVYFFYSATPAGRDTAKVLVRYYEQHGHAPVVGVEVVDLQDEDPKRFRTKGLRNLARELCRVVRERGPSACAINATGGYKAQIAIAVMLGQAIGIPIYYMHERFSEIIAFPPMPVSLDVEVWMRASGLLNVLARELNPVRRDSIEIDELDEKIEALIERVDIEGVEYLELSPTGQIFHESFRQRFRSDRDRFLPPPALSKQPPMIKGNEAHLLAHRGDWEPLLLAMTAEVPAVVRCRSNYFNKDLAEPTRFKESKGEIKFFYTNGTWTAGFIIETTAETSGQRAAMVAVLNEWLSDRK